MIEFECAHCSTDDVSLSMRIDNQLAVDFEVRCNKCGDSYYAPRGPVHKAVSHFLRMTECDPIGDLVNANRDEILRKHEEAIQLIRQAITDSRPDLVIRIIDALQMFHPMHSESWKGWPE